MKSLQQITISLIMLFTVCSCASNKPTQIETTFHAVNYLNPNINNQASPVVVTLYQLKSPTSFEQANFFALHNNATKTLANDLVDRREIEIQPGQIENIRQIISAEASFIGIFVAYRNPDSAKWRQLIAIPSGKKINLQINLDAQTVAATID